MSPVSTLGVDHVYVTVTDPFGNVATFTRSEYVAPDGSVGIGPGGTDSRFFTAS